MSKQLPEQPMAFDSFAEWCLNKDHLSTEARHTVEVLFECAGTCECHEAERILSSLTELHLFWSFKPISDLSPLQTLTNLTELDLRSNQISDLLPLQTLTNLSCLDLNSNRISDLSPLQTLTNLTTLILMSNQISDLSPLRTLANLTTLILNNNQISDLSPLQTLTNLSRLDLNSNRISDLSPLQTLTNLTSLDLDHNQITDLSPLQTLTNLTSIDLSNNQITDRSSPLQLLRQEWLSITLSTNPIDRQKAIEAIEYTYTVLGQEEPDIIFFHSPDAAMTWCSEDEDQQLGASLREQLFPSKKSILEEYLDAALKESQPDREFERGLVKWDADSQERCPGSSPIVTPADLADVLSITQLLVSHSGRMLEAEEQERWRCLNQLIEHCGWLFLFEKGCLVCDRPTKLSLDNQQRLHAEGEPAIEFPDGYHLYSYHGVTLPEKYGKLHPNQWQPQWLLEENNAELRRVLIQGIGYARICQDLQATQLDSWAEYTLLKIDNDADIEPIYLLKMTCPSTGFIHALRVPPNIQSAREAIRWINWGTDPEEFLVQT